MTSWRIWFDPDNPAGVIFEPEPGRCEVYWRLYGLGSQMGVDDEVIAHAQACPSCRAWFERSEKLAVSIDDEHEEVLERTQV